MAKLSTTKQAKSKPKDREATEERLLLAAEQVFSKHGFKGATTRMIAKKADINLALINRYFDGKYGLLIKVIERKHIEMNATILPYAPKKTAREECLAFALHRVSICFKDINFFRIVIAQFLTDQKFLKRFQETLLLFEETSDFENRLNAFNKNKITKKKMKVKSIFESIEAYVFGLIIGSIAHGQSEEDLKKSIHDFCEILAVD